MSGGTKGRTWKLKRPRKKTHRPPNAWQRSATFAQIARAALADFNRTRHLRPKCGAKTRTTGNACCNLALANGKCRLHGGASPKGAEWGKRQFNAKPFGKHTKSDWRRIEAKLQRQAKEDRDRVRRLRAMTDEQFFAYVDRMGRRLNDPHAPVIRNAIRDEFVRRGPDPSKAFAETSSAERAQNPELAEIDRRIAELKAKRDTLEIPSYGVFE